MFKTVFWVFTLVSGVWLFGTGAVVFSMRSLVTNSGVTNAFANGVIYVSVFALVLVLTVAIVFPGLLLLQPIQLWKVVRAEKAAVTPRQRFRGGCTSARRRISVAHCAASQLYIRERTTLRMQSAARCSPSSSHPHSL